METQTYSKDEIWNLIKDIPDPEIPVLTIEELGVLRKVEITYEKVIVSIIPTYTGCPAMQVFQQDILKKLNENKIENVEIKTLFNPPWTSDFLTDKAKEKLENYGIAPPDKTVDKAVLLGKKPTLTCPKCKSKNTELKSPFGSTACKALYICKNCQEPFEYFKCI